MDGAVVRFVVSFFLVENIPALCRAMRGCVEAAKSALRVAAIVASCRQKCCASPRMTKKIVELLVRMARRRNGPAALVAERLATAPSTVVYTHVRRAATLKSRSLHTVHDHRMLFLTAPVAKHHCLRFLDTNPGPLAKIQS
jgi:hypothetical protein